MSKGYKYGGTTIYPQDKYFKDFLDQIVLPLCDRCYTNPPIRDTAASFPLAVDSWLERGQVQEVIIKFEAVKINHLDVWQYQPTNSTIFELLQSSGVRLLDNQFIKTQITPTATELLLSPLTQQQV